MQKSIPNSIPHCVLFLLLVIAPYTCSISIVANNSISYTLPCHINQVQFNIPVNRVKTGSTFVVVLNVPNNTGIPIVMFISGTNSNITQYMPNATTIINKYADQQALHLNKNKQQLYYQSQPDHPDIFILISRLQLKSISYIKNIDRIVQKYNGTNQAQQLYVCTQPIQFTINVTEYNHTQKQLHSSEQLEINLSQATNCVNGAYNAVKKQCECPPGFGMPLCNVYFNQITVLNKSRAFLSPNSRMYFYYQARNRKSIFNTQKYTISMRGDKSGQLRSQSTSQQQIYILTIVLPIQQPLIVPSIFNQQNPEDIQNLSLSLGQKVVIMVYKPQWSSFQQFTIEVSNNYSVLYVILYACFIVLFLIIHVISKYGKYCCRSRYVMFAAQPVRPAFLTASSTSSAYVSVAAVLDIIETRKRKQFNIQLYFPTIVYRQFYDLLYKNTQKYNINSKKQSNIDSNQHIVPAMQENNKQTTSVNQAQIGKQSIEKANIQANRQVMIAGSSRKSLRYSVSYCSICLDSIQMESQVVITYCCHTFHAHCLKRWLTDRKMCPNCRKQFKVEEIEQIEDKSGIKGIKGMSAVERYVRIWKYLKQKQIPQMKGFKQQAYLPCQTSHNLNEFEQ